MSEETGVGACLERSEGMSVWGENLSSLRFRGRTPREMS